MRGLSCLRFPARATFFIGLGATVFLCVAIRARAQLKNMDALAAPLASKLAQERVHRVLVMPLICGDDKDSPLGIWLAKQMSASLVSALPGIEPIALNSSGIPFQTNTELDHLVYDTDVLGKLAKKIGAEITVVGNCAPFGDGLGITIWASKKGKNKILAQSNGVLALTPEIAALASPSLRFEQPADGIYRAGFGGVGTPVCVKCKNPDFPEKERLNGNEGLVVLDVVIGPDGLVHRITVKKATTENLSLLALKAVEKWKFKPAEGPDGKAVAVRVPVEIKFRIFR
jgi:TonB family protein